MINLAVSLPWWDSLDSVRKAHSDLEATSIVGFALLVAFDSVAHMLDKKSPDKARVVAGIGLIFFWLAVGAEILGYEYGQRNDELSENKIRSLDTLANDAETKANAARSDADAAKTTSGTAAIVSGTAINVASGARKEADSFEKDIVSAKKQATKAEADLAESMERAASAQKEVSRLNEAMGGWKLDENAQSRIAAKLKPFSGTPFDLAANTSEAKFMETLHSLLTSAPVGWAWQSPKPTNPLGEVLIDGKASVLLVSGFTLEIDQDRAQSLGPAFVALGNALQAEGIPIAGHFVTAGSWGNRIHIIIGKRE
jgi:hypothetical protein